MSLDPVASSAAHDAAAHQLVLTILGGLSEKKAPSAREAYATLLPALASHDGDVPTGARLVDCVQWFNANRPAGMARIPVGTAGVAQECVTSYRRQLVQSIVRHDVGHPTLPADLLQEFNAWLQRLVDITHAGLQREFTQELAALRAQATEESTRLAEQHAQQLAQLQSACDATQSALSASENQRHALENTLSAQAQEVERLEVMAETLQQRLAASTQQAQAQQQTLQQLDNQLTQSQQALQAAQQAEDAERKERLLLLDTLRVQEQELIREKERHQATLQARQTLERYWQEEKDKTHQLQQALTELQLASAPAAPANTAPRAAVARVQWKQGGATRKLGRKKPPAAQRTGGLR